MLTLTFVWQVCEGRAMHPLCHFTAILGVLLVTQSMALAHDGSPRTKDVCAVPASGSFLTDPKTSVWHQEVM